MMKATKYISLFTLVFFLFAFLAGCTSAEAEVTTEAPTETAISPTGAQTEAAETSAAEDTSYTVTDALGREISFQQVPQRIVLAGRALFMVADALYLFPDAAQHIAAIGQTNQGSGNFIELIDPDYEAKAVLGKETGAEQIAPLQPDAVILKSSLAETLGSSIEALGVPVIYIDFETPEQYSRDLQILGNLLQNDERAAELAALYQERLDQVEKGLSGLEDASRVRTLLIYASDKDGKVAFNVPPMAWMQTQMVEMAGGAPVWEEASLGDGWATVTLEQIAAWDPDVIFVIAYQPNSSEVAASLKSDPNWKLLRAVQQEKLYAFAGDLFSWDQPDPRWILGLQWMAGKLYPDRFTGIDIVEETSAFYQDFYGLDSAFFEEKIRPIFKGDLP